MDGFLKILDNSADFEEISGGLAKGQSPLSVMGVCDSVRAHLSFALCKKRGKAPFFITSTDAQARILWEDLRFFYGDKVLLFPARDLLFYDIEASANEAPYDVFICYKETDFEGKRTLDSVLAMDIYEALTDKGYRVFFSRVSLEDKLGTEYEPFIFAALNSAKIMLVVGTDYEYFILGSRR